MKDITAVKSEKNLNALEDFFKCLLLFNPHLKNLNLPKKVVCSRIFYSKDPSNEFFFKVCGVHFNGS